MESELVTPGRRASPVALILFRIFIVWPVCGALLGFVLGSAALFVMSFGAYFDVDDYLFAMRAVVPVGALIGFVAGLVTVPLTRSKPLGTLLPAFGGGALALGIPAAFVPTSVTFAWNMYYFLPLLGALIGYILVGPFFLFALSRRAELQRPQIPG